jgi:PAS domain S-box-containing protein
MVQPSGLEQVMQICVDEVRNIGLDVHAMAIHRVIDPDQKIIETFRVSPGETISRSQRRRGKRVTECWQAGQILYEKDIYKNDVREIENFRNKFGGLPIRCHLNVPFSRGVISAHSIHPEAFSESDTEILRHIAEIFSVGISRVEDLERVEASQKGLRQSEERYRNLVEHSPYAIFIHVEGKIVFANSATLTLLGASAPENLIGKSVFDFVHPDYLEMARERTRKVHEERRNVLPIEQKFIRLDGTVIEVETQASFFTYQDQPAIQAIVRDISERKRLEQQLFQAQKMEAIGTLAGGIAHDFNNELTGIIGFAQLALLEDLSPQARECIARIPEQGKRAANLISQLLVFSRQAVVEKQTVSLLYLVKEAIRVLEHTLPENIAIRLDAPREVAPVNADPTQMQQVFMNLCINASHAMPDGGDLTVVLEDVTLDEEYCRQYVQARPGHYVCLSVRDTGAGMAPEVQARIFEPFFTTKEVGKGTGLGLAMVYGIVKEHGGHVNVYSEVGKGSEFKVYLPALETGTVKPGVAAQESLVGGTETLLLVEDQEWVMAAGKRMLERLGYTVLTATNGEEAIETYRAHRDAIALVITDMVMPKIGGQELYEALKRMDPDVRALLVSGYSLKEDVSDLRARGLKGFVQKPFDIYKLAQDVRRALDE